MKLSEKLNDMLSRLGGAPEGLARLSIPDVRGMLPALISEAQTLEQSRSLADADTLIAQLKSQAENNDRLLAAQHKEFEVLLKADEKRKNAAHKYQYWILLALPIESDNTMMSRELAASLSLPVDAIEVHLKHLKEENRSDFRTYGGIKHWWRTELGTMFRMAIEEDADNKPDGPPARPSVEHAILKTLNQCANDYVFISTAIKVPQRIVNDTLRKLQGDELVQFQNFGQLGVWSIDVAGKAYLRAQGE